MVYDEVSQDLVDALVVFGGHQPEMPSNTGRDFDTDEGIMFWSGSHVLILFNA